MEIQLGLVDRETGVQFVPTIEVVTEREKSFREMSCIARSYGEELGRLYRSGDITESALNRLIIKFAQTLDVMCERELSATEKGWLKMDVFNSAQPWLDID